VGLVWGGGPDAEETLAALRATYEPLLDGLGAALLLPLPEWIAAEDAADHWEGGHRGLIASRLIAQLSDRATGDKRSEPRERRLSQRLRTRLSRD
jgi:hypothetical protein